jgi:hypothetical protein
MRTWWQKVVRWLVSPSRVAYLRKVRRQPATMRAEQAVRDAVLSDSPEARRFRTNVVVKGLAAALLHGAFWIFLPITGLFWLFFWSKRALRRQDGLDDRQAMKRAAERYNCDGL